MTACIFYKTHVCIYFFQNYAKRSVLRNTWGNPLIIKDFLPEGSRVKLIFILGMQPKEQMMIDYEAEVYEDIVQANFVDHYRNNTYKALYHMK